LSGRWPPSTQQKRRSSWTTILWCYRDFEGAAWAQYGRAYRRQAALLRDLNWSRINTTLYSLCFAGRAKRGKCVHTA
jgi:hypothetical protein